MGGAMGLCIFDYASKNEPKWSFAMNALFCRCFRLQAGESSAILKWI